jgi:hypothetical protein
MLVAVSVAVAFASGCSTAASPATTTPQEHEPTADPGADDAASQGSSAREADAAPADSARPVPDASVTLPADAAVHSLYDASASDADLGESVTLTMDAFTVAPGDEIYMCQSFANPFGRDVDLARMDGYLSAGSHHLFLFNMAPSTGRTAPGPVASCPGQGLEFHPFPYFSQIPGHYVVTYPQPNMGYPIASENGLMLNAHFINATAEPMTPVVTITIWPAKPGLVTTHVGTIWLQNTGFSVPASSGPTWYSASSAPIASEDYTIITNWAHVHSYASEFQASANGAVFYDIASPGTDLIEPPLQTASAFLPMPMKAGTAIDWRCNYTGNGMFDRPFGDSYDKNVMCFYMAQYYPADTTSLSYPDIIDLAN